MIEIEDEPPENPVKALPPVNSELCQVAYEFGKYLNSLPTKTATASQACKFVYGAYLLAQEILNHHGKLRGLVKSCPYLSMQGASHGGTYLLSLKLGFVHFSYDIVSVLIVHFILGSEIEHFRTSSFVGL